MQGKVLTSTTNNYVEQFIIYYNKISLRFMIFLFLGISIQYFQL